jgi:hypothetical protein
MDNSEKETRHRYDRDEPVMPVKTPARLLRLARLCYAVQINLGSLAVRV